MSLLIRGGIVVTMNDRFDIVEGDVSIRDGRIAAIAPAIAYRSMIPSASMALITSRVFFIPIVMRPERGRVADCS